jgi:hypothetical protein
MSVDAEKKEFYINRAKPIKMASINPYIRFFLGKGFKNTVTLMLLLTLMITLIFGLKNGWIGKDLS